MKSTDKTRKAPVVCGECGTLYKNNTGLASHMRIRHGMKWQRESAAAAPPEPPGAVVEEPEPPAGHEEYLQAALEHMLERKAQLETFLLARAEADAELARLNQQIPKLHQLIADLQPERAAGEAEQVKGASQ